MKWYMNKLRKSVQLRQNKLSLLKRNSYEKNPVFSGYKMISRSPRGELVFDGGHFGKHKC